MNWRRTSSRVDSGAEVATVLVELKFLLYSSLDIPGGTAVARFGGDLLVLSDLLASLSVTTIGAVYVCLSKS